MSELNEFEPPPKSAKNRFQLCAGLNLEKLNTILSGTNLFDRRGTNSLNSASGFETVTRIHNNVNLHAFTQLRNKTRVFDKVKNKQNVKQTYCSVII